MITTSTALSSDARARPVALTLRAVGVLLGVATRIESAYQASESGTKWGTPLDEAVAIHTLVSDDKRARVSDIRSEVERFGTVRTIPHTAEPMGASTNRSWGPLRADDVAANLV